MRRRALAAGLVALVAAGTMSSCEQEVTGGRYRNRVFAAAEQIGTGVVYRTTATAAGGTLDLAMDIWQPEGDTADRRPVIVWGFGGGWQAGDRNQLADYARDAALRGYVGVTIDYHIASTATAQGSAPADAYDDTIAAVQYLQANWAKYRLDIGAVITAGYSAGAYNAINTATLPGTRGPAESPVAGVISIAGNSFAPAKAGLPPIVMFGARDDTTVPFAGQDSFCASYRDAGNVCEMNPYETGGHLFAVNPTVKAEIQEQAARFVAEKVLPLHYYTFTS
jgi:acetyl esterase/lipase